MGKLHIVGKLLVLLDPLWGWVMDTHRRATSQGLDQRLMIEV